MNNPGEIWRLFIAVPVPDDIKGGIADWCREHKPELSFQKWVYSGDYHITLQFLGDVEVSRLQELSFALEAGVRGTSTFELGLADIGTFGQKEHPRVLWVGINGEMDRLHGLYKQVTEVMQPLGFKPEERPYNPHVTLARRYAEQKTFAQPAAPPPAFGSFTVNKAVIYRTNMGAKPMYEIVGAAEFK